MEWRLSKEDLWASRLKSGMNTLVATKPRRVSQGANASLAFSRASGWSGVIVMMDRWWGMWGAWRLSAMASPLEDTSTSSDPHGYLPTLTSKSLIFTCNPCGTMVSNGKAKRQNMQEMLAIRWQDEETNKARNAASDTWVLG